MAWVQGYCEVCCHVSPVPGLFASTITHNSRSLHYFLLPRITVEGGLGLRLLMSQVKIASYPGWPGTEAVDVTGAWPRYEAKVKVQQVAV